MALAGVEHGTLVSETDALTTRPSPCVKPPVEFVRKKLDNAIDIMCSLRLSIDVNLKAFIPHL